MKQLPFTVTNKEKDRSLCSLYTFANVFGDSDFLAPELKDGWADMNGMLLSEENAILNLTNGTSLEEQVVDQDGLPYERVIDFVEYPDTHENVFVYPMRAIVCGSCHRFAIATTSVNMVYLIDILAPNILATPNLIASIFNAYKVISIGCFVSDRKPKVFTKKELEHIIW